MRAKWHMAVWILNEIKLCCQSIVFWFCIFSCLFATALTADSATDNRLTAIAFDRVEQGKTLSFPKDHQLHPNFQTEWWYLTANLQDKQGRHYGAQFTLFSTANVLNSKKQRLYFGHVALSTASQFFFAERYARDDMQLAGVTPNHWRAYIDHWQMVGTNDAPLPGHVEIDEPGFGYQLNLSSANYFAQGLNGFSAKNADASLASYYYSAPFVEVQGDIRIGDQVISVSGTGWLDREWSSAQNPVAGLGWDWLSLHLDEQRALMLYRIRSNGEQYLYARLMYKSGRQLDIPADQIDWLPTHWQTFAGKRYPIRLQLRIPSQAIDVEIIPLNNQQYLSTRVPYWEGAISTKGTHQSRGYLELFGY